MSDTAQSAGPDSADDPQEPQASPHWKTGPFEIRLPFVHYRIEWPDYAQGLFMCAVDLAATR